MRPFSSLRRVVILLAVCGLASTLSAQISIGTGDIGGDGGNSGSGVLGAGTRRMGPVQDDATARREAMLEWHGVYTPEYRQFLMLTAQRERERWGSLIPGNHLYQPVRAAGNHWSNIGPTNATFEKNGVTLNVRDSGRPAAIVIHPTDSNIIYNATSGGGVWKTTNGGTSWTPITEAIGSLSCGDLAIDPSNPNTLYLGLGDAFDGTGVGLYKTIDAGANWTGPVFLGSSTVINAVAVSPTSPNVVLAATNAGLFRSANANGGLGGGSFSPVSLGALVNPNCWSLAYAGGTNWVVSVTTGTDATTGNWNGVKLFYSSDDGLTWTAPTGFAAAGGRTTLASAPSNRSMVYAMVANPTVTTKSDLQQFYRSSDAGHTWASLGLTTSKKYANSTKIDTGYANVVTLLGGQAWYNQLFLVDPADSTILWAGGTLALCKITGATSTPVYTIMSNWLAQFSMPYIHADFHAGAFAPNGTLYMGTDGGIFKRTSAATNTWTSDLNIGITSHLFYSVGSSPANTTAVIGGLQDNGTRVRSGSTSTFNQTLGGDGFGSYIHQLDATKQIATLYDSRVYKSTDSGANWTQATGISGTNTVFITKVPPSLADVNGDTLFTSTNDTVYRSTDFGSSFTALGRTGLPAVDTTPPIAAGTLYIRNIGAAPSAINTIGIVANTGRVFITTNGTSWTQAASPPNNGSSMSYISFAKASSQVVYVASVAPDATKNHLWKSSNGGSTWAALDGSAASPNGLPFGIPINSIVEDPGDSQTLYAGTELGVYRTIDGGATWARFGSGLPLVNVTDFYITPNSSLIRISTFGRGIWEFDTSSVTAAITAPASDGLAFVHGSPITFTGTGTGGGTLTYSWNFGDGSTGTGASASHAYFNYAGFDVTYYATLTVTSSLGGSVSTTRTVKVHTAPPATAIAISTNQISAAVPPNYISPVTFTAVGSGSLNTPPAGYKYQFWVRYPAASLWTMVQDFGPDTFVLTAPLGLNYGVGVDVRTSAYPLAPNNWDVFTAINHFNIALTNLRGPVSEPAVGHVPQVDLTGQLKEPMTFEQFHQFRRMIEAPQPQPTAPPTQD